METKYRCKMCGEVKGKSWPRSYHFQKNHLDFFVSHSIEEIREQFEKIVVPDSTEKSK